MIDFLGVSSPCILEDAGYNDEEGDALMQMSDALEEDEINAAELSDVNEPQIEVNAPGVNEPQTGA